MAIVETGKKDLVLPSEEDASLARESFRELVAQVEKERICVAVGEDTTIELPPVAIQLLVRLLGEIAKGNAVTVVPVHAELTTQQAADVLNVSRPYLIQKLEAGELPFHRVGTHRRIRFQDVMAYKEAIREEQRNALDELTSEAQDLDMGYE